MNLDNEADLKWFIASMEKWMGLGKNDPPEKFEDFKRKMRRREGMPYDAPLDGTDTEEVSESTGGAPVGEHPVTGGDEG